MKVLPPHSIPEDIIEIEFNDDTVKFDALREFVSRTNETSYIKSVTGMILLCEAKEYNRLKKFDQQKVQMVLYSNDERVFKIKIDVGFDLTLDHTIKSNILYKSIYFIQGTNIT